MSVSLLGSPPTVVLPPAVGESIADRRAAREARDALPDALPVAAALPAAMESESESAPVAREGDRVTLSSARATTDAAAPAPVYAEVWKNGLKVAVIDSHGSVTSLNGLVSVSPTDHGGGGPQLAARRAMQIARNIGGEIRVAGQMLDVPTLAMRTKLQAAYGA